MSKQLLAVVKAASVFVSNDKTRPHLSMAFWDAGVRTLSATSGVVGVILKLDDTFAMPPAPCFINCKQTLLTVAAGMPIAGTVETFTFPNLVTAGSLRRITPARGSGSTTTADPLLLGTCLSALGHLAKALKVNDPAVTVQPGGEHDPIRIDADFYSVKVLALVMPVRSDVYTFAFPEEVES
jgi:hypothetical protein